MNSCRDLLGYVGAMLEHIGLIGAMLELLDAIFEHLTSTYVVKALIFGKGAESVRSIAVLPPQSEVRGTKLEPCCGLLWYVGAS